jgi:hypothetical protein
MMRALRMRVAAAAAVLALAVLAEAGRRLLERRVSSVLGVEPGLATAMLVAARGRLTAADYGLRAVSFVVATSAAGPLLPAGRRERAVRSLVGKLLERPADVLFYLGELPEAPGGSCRGLVEA